MKHLFAPEGGAVLAATMARRPLLAFDFDGTLAPIVARPEDARVSQAVARRLDRLAAILPLAIISGRKVEDVRTRLAFAPHYIIGNHGAEDASVAAPVDRSAIFQGLRARLREYAFALDASGVTVEDKQQSFALHYRLARDRDKAFELIGQLLSGLGPELEIFGGKMVVNIVAAASPDKADAVVRLLERSGATSAVFVGDDLNDEPVFARAPASWLTVRVGRDDPASQAMFCLDNFGEVATMLDRMLAALADLQALR
ncbi:MAG: trehalose-phosphatase [Rhodoferax sp.]|nr:trehalose-phosphatase [Rhodoferax sp.]